MEGNQTAPSFLSPRSSVAERWYTSLGGELSRSEKTTISNVAGSTPAGSD